MKASDKLLHHWKEHHLYLSGKLISSHCELYRVGKSFLENLLRNEILRQRNISDFQKFAGIQNNRYNPVIRLKSFALPPTYYPANRASL